MFPQTLESLYELAFRESDGIEVALLWPTTHRRIHDVPSGLRRTLGREAPGAPLDLLEPLGIRDSREGDRAALERLAVLDSGKLGPESYLLAEVDGELVAAAALDLHEEPLSDPFRPTAGLRELLRLRTRQIRSSRGALARRRGSAARSRRGGVTNSTASKPMLALVLLCAAQFMVILDVTVVNVALPSIQADLGFAFGDLQWVVTAYTLAFGGLLLLGGRAADLLGRRRVFLAGLGLFTAASLASGLAASQEMLLAARALQGLGAALLSPAALSLITAIFPEGPARNRALAAWAAVGASGAAFGVLLGGSLTDAFGWEAIFLVNLPVGLAVALASVRALPANRAAQRRRVDVGGALIATGSWSR
jgi:hypothetical protein